MGLFWDLLYNKVILLYIETSIKYDTFRKTGLYTSKHRPDGRNGYYGKYQTSVQDSIKGSGIYVSVMFPRNMFNNSASHTIYNEKGTLLILLPDLYFQILEQSDDCKFILPDLLPNL